MLIGVLLALTSPLQVSEKNLAALPEDIRPAQVIVSPDQSRFAWILRGEDSFCLVVDDQKQKPCDWIIHAKADFTADSQHIAYAARKRRKALMVIDGNDGELADAISDWITSSGGGQVACAATRNGRSYAILNNTPGPAFEFVQLHALAARGTLAYMALEAKKQFAIIDGNKSKGHDLVTDIRLSPDGRRFAYVATSAGQTRMIIDDQPGPPLDTISPAIFSADGKHVAYLATRGNDSVVILDGEARTYPGKLSGFSFSADGSRHLLISTKDARDTLYMDGAPGPAHPAISAARFSADGRHIAYAIQTLTGQRAIIDNKPVAHFDQILSIHPSPTGHSFAFVAQRGGKSLILLDDRETPEYEAILGRHSPHFQENGSLRFLALKHGQIVQVTAGR